MADPTQFLSTITAASAGLVAIIGGLLVNRFIGLDSEQQGAQALLDHAEERLMVARSRAADAKQQRVEFEAMEFFEDIDVLEGICNGIVDFGELLRISELSPPLTEQQIKPYLQQTVDEFRRARDYFERLLPPSGDLSAVQWEAINDWGEFREKFVSELPQLERVEVWRLSFEAVIKSRSKNDEFNQSIFGFDPSTLIPEQPIYQLSRTIRSNQEIQRAEQRRTVLNTASTRASQQLEDAEADVTRLREQRDKIVRPDKQLWIGIAVLLYPTIVGVILPILAMREGPTDFTGYIRLLALLFISGLVVLIGYMTYLATRLSRRHRWGHRQRQ